MGLFGRVFGKEEKKSCCDVRIVEVPEGDEAPDACDCGGACDAPTGGVVALTILGPGCKRCRQLNDSALALAARSAKPLNVEYSTDPVAIAEAGIMATPALLVDGKVVSQGKVLTESEIEELL